MKAQSFLLPNSELKCHTVAYSCLLVESRLHDRPTERMPFVNIKSPQNPSLCERILEIDTSFMVYEIQVTCRKLVNQYAFHFFFSNTLNLFVSYRVEKNDASRIEVLFWINSWLVLFGSSEILSN